MTTRATRGRFAAVGWPRVDARLLAGLALAAVAVIGSLTLWRQAQVTVPVVVAAREIPAGRVIEPDDLELTQARLEGRLASLAIGESEVDAVVGRTAGSAIHAGGLVLRPDLTTGPVIAPGQVAVTVPVQADSVYGQLRRGDEVAVTATSDRGQPQSLTVMLLERATVFEVALESSRVSLGGGNRHDGEGGRLTNVTLLVPRTDAEAVAHAVVNADLTLLLLAPAAAAEEQR